MGRRVDAFEERGRIKFSTGREMKWRMIYGDRPGVVSVAGFDVGCDTFLAEKCRAENRSFFSFTPSETKLHQVRNRHVIVNWDFNRLTDDTAAFFHRLIRQRAYGPHVVVASSLGARAALDTIDEAGQSATKVVLLSPEVYLRQILRPAFHPTWGNHRFYRDNGYFDHAPSTAALLGGAASPLVRVTKEHTRAMRAAEDLALAVPCPVMICRSTEATPVQRAASDKLLGRIEAPEKAMKDIKRSPRRPNGSASDVVWSHLLAALSP